MVERITPEIMVTMAIASLAALTFLMVLMALASLSRVKRRLLHLGEKLLEVENQQAALQQVKQMMSNNIAGQAEATDKITSIERRLDGFEGRIAENRNQLTGHVSKLNEYDNLLGQTGQLMGKNAAGFNQAIQRIHTLEDDFQGIKAFQRTFEQTRNRILDALGAAPAKMLTHNPLPAERDPFKEEALISSEAERPDAENLRYRYP